MSAVVKQILAYAVVAGLSVACGSDKSSDNDKKADSGAGSDKDSSADEKDAGPEYPPVEGITGTATKAKCLTYALAEDGKCGSLYCGVEESYFLKNAKEYETEVEKLGLTGACNGGDVAFACRATLPLNVGKCARALKSKFPMQTHEELRPQVEKCVYEDAEIKELVTKECMGCYLDAAECAADNCLVACLAGDSPQCDTCRAKAGCDAKVFPCSGLPSPL